MTDHKEMIERLQYHVQNPSAWEHGFDEKISDLIDEAARALRASAGREMVDVDDLARRAVGPAREAYDASIEMQPRETGQAWHDAMCAAIRALATRPRDEGED